MQYMSSTPNLPGLRLFSMRSQDSLRTLKKYLGALEVRGHHYVTWKVVRRSRATLAVACGMGEKDIQTKGEWSSKAYKVYVAKDEVERLQRFGQMVDDSSDSEHSDEMEEVD